MNLLTLRRGLAATLLACVGLVACGKKEEPAAAAPPPAAPAAEVPTYKVAWSHYVGWEPWGYAESSGILDKWAKKYGIKIELTLVNDYVESINLYTSGQFDACVMTNMDALTIPAIGGVDSQAIIVGDFSNGNDGIVMKNGSSVADLKGRTINLVELSVSHYLLARALDKNGLSEKDVTLVNTSDADIASVFAADPNGAVVTWNPPLAETKAVEGAKEVFDSSQIPGEIIDLMVARTQAPETLKKALTGAWYETMSVLQSDADARKAAMDWIAASSGTNVEGIEQQLSTTAMFYKPEAGASFAKSDDLKATMDHVRQFSFAKGLYSPGSASPDVVGIEFDDGSIMGAKDNVKLRFTSSYMTMAAEGKL